MEGTIERGDRKHGPTGHCIGNLLDMDIAAKDGRERDGLNEGPRAHPPAQPVSGTALGPAPRGVGVLPQLGCFSILVSIRPLSCLAHRLVNLYRAQVW